MQHYRRLFAYVRPYLWPRAVAAIACMLAASALEGAVPLLARFTFDAAFDAQRTHALVLAVAALIVLAIARGGMTFAASYLSDWLGQRAITDVRNAVVRHIEGMDVALLDATRAGQLVSRVVADVSLIRGLLTDATTSVIRDATRVGALIVVAIMLDPTLAGLGLGLLPIAAAPLWWFSRQLRQTSRQQQEGMGRLTALLHETLQGHRVVQAFGQEHAEAARLTTQSERLFRLFLRASVLRSVPLADLIGGLAAAAVLWWGGASVIAGVRTQGTLMAFVVTLFLLYQPLRRLVQTNFVVQQGLAGAERVFGFLDTTPAIVDRPHATALLGVRNAIAFERVTFGYEPGVPVLQAVDLRIPVGAVIAVVGPSGSGKSTLADLLLRFHDPTEGRITIDGRDLRALTLASLRARIAIVHQFPFLFNETIRWNIAFGAPGCSDAEVVAAARAANAHEFIAALPAGYDTRVGDLGVRLSGGQRQRIAIARALLRDAPILVLDEATSSLDPASEATVQEALDRLMAHRTTLVIAHRPSTLRGADGIVVLCDGRIVESGTHAELVGRPSLYRTLYEAPVDSPPATAQRSGTA
jgi:subfamily B ATP-binding cassette protein MsbA